MLRGLLATTAAVAGTLRPGLWVLLAVAGDDLEVTSQGRLELAPVTQAVQVIHGVLQSPAVNCGQDASRRSGRHWSTA